MHAQYFGQNKVRYKKLAFKVLHTTHFDIYYYPEEYNPAIETGRMAERWYKRHSDLLKFTLTSGGTSPVAGQRCRAELDGSGGTLSFSTVLLDYRKYFRIRSRWREE